MQKYIKAGVLTLVLVLPAFLILFFHGFAENHFQLPYLIPLTDSGGNVSMRGQDTLFYQVPSTSGTVIRVVGFFDKETSSLVSENFSIVEKLASDKVVMERVIGEEAGMAAFQKYRVQTLKKAKTSETIPYNDQFLLIDSKGFIRGLYNATSPEDVERLTAEVKVLLDIQQKEEN